MDELERIDETTVSQYEDEHALDYYEPRDIISSYIYFYRPSNGQVENHTDFMQRKDVTMSVN